MYIDTQAALQAVAALLILANTIVTWLTNRKVNTVNTKVNGLTDQALAGARAEGLAHGAGLVVPPAGAPPLV